MDTTAAKLININCVVTKYRFHEGKLLLQISRREEQIWAVPVSKGSTRERSSALSHKSSSGDWLVRIHYPGLPGSCIPDSEITPLI